VIYNMEYIQDLLTVFITAALPVGELRISIPLGIIYYELSWPVVFLFSLLGNLLPVVFVYRLLSFISLVITFLPEPISRIWVYQKNRSQSIFSRYSTFVNSKIEKHNNSRYFVSKDYAGLIVLILLVAIPLPFTGAWTATIAAWIFGIPFKTVFFAISAGLIIAGTIVTSAVLFLDIFL